MKAREKLLITISLLACGVAIGVFALVSLGHFIYSPNRVTIPVVAKMYEGTVQQVATLEPIPVPPAPNPVATNSTPAPVSDSSATEDSTAASKSLAARGKNYKNQRDKNDQSYLNLKKTLAALFGLL